jgi:hypothetical protein
MDAIEPHCNHTSAIALEQDLTISQHLPSPTNYIKSLVSKASRHSFGWTWKNKQGNHPCL